MKHLYFVRHGLSVMNEKNVFSGQTDTPLSADGQQQSHAAGQELRNVGVDCIVSSPITRAYDTAVIIAAEIGFDVSNIITSDYFIERDFGPLEGTKFTTNIDLDTTEGVEHSSDIIARVTKGLDFLHGLDATTVLVVSHGATGRALRYLVQAETPFHGSKKIPNAQVVQLL